MWGQAVNYKRSWKDQRSLLGAGWGQPIWRKNLIEIFCAVRLALSVRWITDSCKVQLGAVWPGLWCNRGCVCHHVPHSLPSTYYPATSFNVNLTTSKQPRAFTPENKVSLGWFDNCVQELMSTSCVVSPTTTLQDTYTQNHSQTPRFCL